MQCDGEGLWSEGCSWVEAGLKANRGYRAKWMMTRRWFYGCSAWSGSLWCGLKRVDMTDWRKDGCCFRDHCVGRAELSSCYPGTRGGGWLVPLPEVVTNKSFSPWGHISCQFYSRVFPGTQVWGFFPSPVCLKSESSQVGLLLLSLPESWLAKSQFSLRLLKRLLTETLRKEHQDKTDSAVDFRFRKISFL